MRSDNKVYVVPLYNIESACWSASTQLSVFMDVNIEPQTDMRILMKCWVTDMSWILQKDFLLSKFPAFVIWHFLN